MEGRSDDTCTLGYGPNHVGDHLPPIRNVPEEVATLSMEQIEIKSYVGGLVKSFERKAA